MGSDREPNKTEFMTHISGISYSVAKENKIIADIDGLQLPVIHYNHLIQNKKSTGRTKDIVDVKYLEKIVLLKNKGHDQGPFTKICFPLIIISKAN